MRPWIAGLLGLLATLAPGAAAGRDLGMIGASCRVERVPAPSRAPAPEAEAWPRPSRTRLTVVVDVACEATVRVLDEVRSLRRLRPDVDVEVLLVDPSAFQRLDRARRDAVLAAARGLELTWPPGRLARMRLTAVPFLRAESPGGQVLTAVGTPSLASLLEGLR
jgi:hypothetical protein